MSTNRIKGAVKQATGSIKKVAGQVTGNDMLRAKGVVEKLAGTVQNALGKVQDKVGDALKRR